MSFKFHLFVFFSFLLTACGASAGEYPKSKAERELDSMESVIGGDGLTFHPGRIKNESTKKVDKYSAPSVNLFLWKASLEVLRNFPLSSIDKSSGIIVTDWYSDDGKNSSEFRINLSITGDVISPESIEVKVFEKKSGKNSKAAEGNNSKVASSIEKKIIEKARALYIESDDSK